MSKEIKIGNIKIGGKNKVAVQSMTTTKNTDIAKTVKQIKELEKAGCDIVRVAVLDKENAIAIKDIKKEIEIPLVADIHFNYKLAILAVENGADKIRFNPGNIGDNKKLKYLIDFLKERNIPVRIGVNSGSLEKEYEGLPLRDGMLKSALKNIKTVEDLKYDNIVVSVKSSNVLDTIDVYEKLSKKTQYPLHLGVTEAGVYSTSVIKSSVALGVLLNQNIGDTIRVSITGNPVREVEVARDILFSLGLLKEPHIEVISCPTCGRTNIDIEKIALKVKEMTKGIKKDLKIAVMGCVVNGIGESKDANIGIAGGKDKSVLFKDKNIVKTVDNKNIFKELMRLIETYGE